MTARPTSQQEAVAKERHVEATPVQRQHVEAAGKDRALFSKQNHDEPPVAATPRAAVVQGAGVSRGSDTPVAAKSKKDVPLTGTEKSGPAVNKETPKAEEQRRPAQEQPKAEERRPAHEQPKAEERRPAQEQPRIEERRPVQEPRGNQAPQAMPQRPAAAQPARPPGGGSEGGGQGGAEKR